MMDVLFHGSALAVLPFWAVMILAPRWSWTQRLVATPWIAVPPALCFLALVLPNAEQLVAPREGSGPERMAILMGQPWAASAFYAYAGAFDLFVGRWMFFDSRDRGISHLWVAPVLFVCILLGPVAFLMYAALCAVFRRGRHP